MDKKISDKIKDISHDYSVMFNSEDNSDTTEQLMDINMDVIDIINVDLEVELFNGFLAKELEDKRKEELNFKSKIKRKQDEEIRKRKEDENYKKIRGR